MTVPFLYLRFNAAVLALFAVCSLNILVVKYITLCASEADLPVFPHWTGSRLSGNGSNFSTRSREYCRVRLALGISQVVKQIEDCQAHEVLLDVETERSDSRLYELTFARLKYKSELRVERATEFRLSEQARAANLSAFHKTMFISLEKTQGGLGNVLFQLASAYGVAKTNNRGFALSFDDLRFRYFAGLDVRIAPQPSGAVVFPERWCCKYNADTENIHRTYRNQTVALSGYLQSWKYFDKYREDIINVFTFNLDIYQRALQALNRSLWLDLTSVETRRYRPKLVTRSIPVLVGLHVRRGDILQDLFQSYGHTAATDQYLLRSAMYFERKFDHVIFVIVSNNITYCRSVFGNQGNVIYVSTTEAADMALMTLMDHLVISVGTYGFWSAYLGSQEREVVYYNNWPKKGSKLDLEFSHADYFLPWWMPRA